MFGSFLPSLRSLSNHSLLGSRSRHCYAIMWITCRVARHPLTIRWHLGEALFPDGTLNICAISAENGYRVVASRRGKHRMHFDCVPWDCLNEKKPANVLSPSGGVFLPQDSGAVPRPSPIRWIRLPLRIQPLHLIKFVGRDQRQVPDEQNQAPGFLGSVRFAEGWHAAQTNPICNCVVELAIALVLRPGCTQVGRFRIEALAE